MAQLLVLWYLSIWIDSKFIVWDSSAVFTHYTPARGMVSADSRQYHVKGNRDGYLKKIASGHHCRLAFFVAGCSQLASSAALR